MAEHCIGLRTALLFGPATACRGYVIGPATACRGYNSRHDYCRHLFVHHLRSRLPRSQPSNIDIDIPRGQLIAFCGLSGSGKTSLALDTLYAEGQRCYIESFSAYTRQYLARLDKPDCDSIDGIPPAIAVTRAAARPIAARSARPPRSPNTCGCCSPKFASCFVTVAASRSSPMIRPKSPTNSLSCQKIRDR